MIDITVDNNEVTIGNQKFHSFNNKEQLLKLIAEILEKAYFSGESISLHVLKYSPKDKQIMKFFINEW
jgi:hypothetical protein